MAKVMDKEESIIPVAAYTLQDGPITDLALLDGVVIRQKTLLDEAVIQTIGVPVEMKNRYKLAKLPNGKNVAKSHGDSTKWTPTHEELLALDEYLFVCEDSSFASRLFFACCGCSQNRPLKLKFYVDPKSGESYIADRKFACGGICCCPFKMTLSSAENEGGQYLGRIREDFDNYFQRCCRLMCCCESRQIVERYVGDSSPTNFEKLYTIRVNTACCGPHDNCCGATCCRPNMIFNIYDKRDNVVATIQKTYGVDGGMSAFCRCMYLFSNYTMSFPPDSTMEDRMLLITSIFQIDFMLFDTKNN